MAILKCKMCGGNLDLIDDSTVVECEYCGTKQTVPNADNDKKMMMFERANKLRYTSEFDKAASIYESIVADFPYEAEAYWGLVLCKYGIEYVDDPATGNKIPTCHRSSFDSVMDDSDFEQVMENADPIARRVYRDEAKAIEDIRKGILEVSSKEEPYDIFICYKETDENGERTIDSVIAQDIYDSLTEKGYRIFFARISLEDKLGTAYEPYIFAALNSAKIMLAVGTDYDYYNAVWVKNEWSRFLALIAKGEKKTLIPCYKDIDAYDIPREFKHLQAQDMGKVGAMQDLLRGIGKILGTKKQNTPSVNVAADSNVSAMIQRGNMALEDGDFNGAVGFFERALDANPKEAHAYLGKFLALHQLKSLSDLQKKVCYLENNKEYKRAEQFADPVMAKELKAVRESNELKIQRLRFLDVIRKVLNNQEAQIKEEEERRRKEEEENRKKEQERKEKEKIETEYQLLLTINELKTKIRCLDSEHNEVSQKIGEYQSKTQQRNDLMKDQESFEANISELEKELSSLGRLAFSRKKTINANLVTTRTRLEETKRALDILKRELNAMDINALNVAREEAEKELSQAKADLKAAENELWQGTAEKSTRYGKKLGDILFLSNTLVEDGILKDLFYSGYTYLDEKNKREFLDREKVRILVIPDMVTHIGSSAFSSWKTLTHVIIPKGVMSIGDYAFWNCESLTSVSIPGSVTSIGKSAFSSCKTLTHVIIPKGVTSIGEQAFCDCNSLTSISISGSVTIIGDKAFLGYYDNRLMSITVAPENRFYDSRNNCNALIETATNKLLKGSNTTVIPDGVTKIDEDAFYGCKSLTSVSIPGSVICIGESAFHYCGGLESINVDPANKKYDSRNNCNAIIETETNTLLLGSNNTVIPDGITKIEESAFYGCKSLTSVSIPGSVTNIGKGAFSSCCGLESIKVDPTNKYYDSRNNCNALIETETNTLIKGCNNTVIPDGVTKISESAFSGCKRLTSITIPDSVTSIGQFAFSDCENLTSVTIPRNVSLGYAAFVRCNNLSEESRVIIEGIQPGASH